MGIVVLIAVLRAVGGGVLQQVDAVGIILRVLRARSGLRRGGHVALLVIAIGLHRLLPQGNVIKPSRTRVVVVGAVNMDVFHRFAASLWHDGSGRTLPVRTRPLKRNTLRFSGACVCVNNLCD